MTIPDLLSAVATLLVVTTAGAQTIQHTTVHAPISAVAVGPAYASVRVNTRPGDHMVSVRKPLAAVATPFRSMRIRVN